MRTKKKIIFEGKLWENLQEIWVKIQQKKYYKFCEHKKTRRLKQLSKKSWVKSNNYQGKELTCG